MSDQGNQLPADGTDAGSLDAQCRMEAARREVICWLLSGLMHESRNALQQIGSCAEMLAIQLADQPAALDLVQGVEEAQGLLVRMLNDLRTYSAPLEPAYRAVELAALWRQAWHDLPLGDRWPPAELRERTLPADTRCQADPALLTQTFTALFRHALDTAGSIPRIEIACHEGSAGDQPALVVAIACPGRQPAPEELRQLFDPFICRQPGGSGLELAIARRLVELHGGTLAARGAELVLTLPRRPAKKP